MLDKLALLETRSRSFGRALLLCHSQLNRSMRGINMPAASKLRRRHECENHMAGGHAEFRPRIQLPFIDEVCLRGKVNLAAAMGTGSTTGDAGRRTMPASNGAIDPCEGRKVSPARCSRAGSGRDESGGGLQRAGCVLPVFASRAGPQDRRRCDGGFEGNPQNRPA